MSKTAMPRAISNKIRFSRKIVYFIESIVSYKGDSMQNRFLLQKIQEGLGFATSMFRFLFFLMGFTLSLQSNPFSAASPAQQKSEKVWFLSESQMKKFGSETVVFLDTRSIFNRIRNRHSFAKTFSWEEISLEKSPNKGKLKPKEEILKILKSYGIQTNTTVFVIGDGIDGWGEEGRLVWSLREVGIHNSFWIEEGGLNQLAESFKSQNANPKDQKLLKSNPNETLSVSKEDIQNNRLNSNFKILDVREEREFAGSTPYGETRGGHIPGANHLYFKDLFDSQGKLKSKEQVRSLLFKKNISEKDTIVAYCTGGVRSAFVVGVLRSYGFDAKNYPGSMWEWSADSNLPLIK